MQKIQFLGSIFRLRFDACISGNIQPIDLDLLSLVDLVFNDRLCSFLCLGCHTDAVLFRHLAQSKHRAKRFLDQVTSQCRLFPHRRKTCTSNLYVDLIIEMEERLPAWKVIEFLEVE